MTGKLPDTETFPSIVQWCQLDNEISQFTLNIWETLGVLTHFRLRVTELTKLWQKQTNVKRM